MKQAVDLSPAAVIISTLIGGSLLGFAGALLALPIAATLKVVLVEVWLHPGEGWPQSGQPAPLPADPPATPPAGLSAPLPADPPATPLAGLSAPLAADPPATPPADPPADPPPAP